MRGDDERMYPPGTVPGAVGALGLVAAAVLVAGVVCGWLFGSCKPEPVQMIPPPVVHSTATASAQVVATQSVRVTIRRSTEGMGAPAETQSWPRGSFSESPDFCKYPNPGKQVSATITDRSTKSKDPSTWGPEEIVVEVSQAIAAAATSSAEASSSVPPNRTQDAYPSHGRLAVALLTMPGVLAADLQLLSLDVSPATRWLVNVDMEIGADLAGNTEAGAVGVTAGSKVFGGVYYWSRWNLSAQGPALAAGIRF